MIAQEAASRSATARLLKLNEAATWLSCSRRYLDDLVRRGRLQAVRLDPESPKTARIRSDELERFMSGLSKHTVGAA